MRLKRLKWLGLLGVLGAFLGGSMMTAHATDTNATAAMPQGVGSLENIFTMPSLSGKLSNSAKLITSTNSENAGQPAVQITDAKNQVGAVWSTTDNLLDLSKDETASMWLYFGGNADTPLNGTGDGMAFVLQNVGPSAITSGISSKVSPGQTLGVWGLDNDNTASNATTIAAKAIQKSWALEFDEYDNGSRQGNDNGGFDGSNGVDGSHIASNYPGEASSYTRHGTTNNSNKYYYTLNHQGIIGAQLSDGAWHHVTLTWQAPAVGETAGRMTYTFNDKNPTTGLSQTATATKTETVDIAKLGLAPIATTTSAREVYWGFTGSTGGAYANNVVAFDQVPGLVDASADMTIKDETLDKTLKTSDDYVNGNDDLTYQYNLTYNGGKQDWTNLVTSLPKPADVTFSGGTITYADKTQEDFTAAELNSATITHKLGKALSATNKTATVKLTGKAKAVTTNTPVAAANQSFNGSNSVVATESPAYTIYPARSLYLRMASTNGSTVKTGESLPLSGTVSVDSSEKPDDPIENKDVTLHTTLSNGNTIDNFTLNGTTSNADEEGAFNFQLPASKLSPGVNQVTMYATDDRGHRSNTVTFDIVLNGELKFGTVSQKSSFKDTVLTGNTQEVLRQNDWQVEVDNTLGSGTSWTLQAAASQFTDDLGRSLRGQVIYVDNADQTHTLSTTPTTIMKKTATQASETTDVAADWTDKTGLMLKVNGDAMAGSYSGEITWTLTNSVPS
ncbi:WxL domain-containing protein [Levilactobacillus acidifarinae]|nr:WxL domain-containing protein [Levilactobacillus acidifarinae]GEO69692.1 cell surface protein [Levilactobacillus acidifarinae]